jgi:hypothetical protein
MQVSKSFHMAMSVDADRFTDAYIRRNILPFVSHKFEHPELFRRACRAEREKGHEVFPPCNNTDARGYCAGHEEEPTPPAGKGE